MITYWTVPNSLPRQPGRKKLWITADQHYGHKKILAYQGRPYPDIVAMNSDLAARHNSKVSKHDHVIHIGDFSFGGPEFFRSTALALNGVHYFMDGSHDRAMRAFFTKPDIYGGTENRLFLLPKLFEFTYSGRQVVLCHYRLESWWASHHGKSVHFHGHHHAKRPPKPRCRDIGVDCPDVNFGPILIDDAINSVL